MDNLEKLLRSTLLYDVYKNLLTEKQKMYFEDYYFANLSLSEIANKYSVSRNAIYSQLTLLNEELEGFESKLKLLEKGQTRQNIIDKLKKNADEKTLELLKKLEEI